MANTQNDDKSPQYDKHSKYGPPNRSEKSQLVLSIFNVHNMAFLTYFQFDGPWAVLTRFMIKLRYEELNPSQI